MSCTNCGATDKIGLHILEIKNPQSGYATVIKCKAALPDESVCFQCLLGAMAVAAVEQGRAP